MTRVATAPLSGIPAGTIITCANGCRLAEATEDILPGDYNWSRKTREFVNEPLMGLRACPKCGADLVPKDSGCFVEVPDDDGAH